MPRLQLNISPGSPFISSMRHPGDHAFLLETDLQGLLLAWDFNQPEAEAAFRLALQADANASMAQWGIQYSIGPGANR